MSDVTQWILCFCAVFIAIQSFECSRFLQKIYVSRLEQKEYNAVGLTRITEVVNFLNGIESPLHNFIDPKKNK